MAYLKARFEIRTFKKKLAFLNAGKKRLAYLSVTPFSIVCPSLLPLVPAGNSGECSKVTHPHDPHEEERVEPEHEEDGHEVEVLHVVPGRRHEGAVAQQEQRERGRGRRAGDLAPQLVQDPRRLARRRRRVRVGGGGGGGERQ